MLLQQATVEAGWRYVGAAESHALTEANMQKVCVRACVRVWCGVVWCGVCVCVLCACATRLLPSRTR